MSALFDENDEQERYELKMFEFYQIFSAEVRKKLLGKNVPVIHNVYDVLYPKTKEMQMSRNVPSIISIDSTADSIRDALISKIVEENLDLEKFSENFRKSILSRNNLDKSSIDLEQKTQRIRKEMLSKNKSTDLTPIDDVADVKRRESLSMNKENPNANNINEKNNQSHRENNLSKNVLSDSLSNIDSVSEAIRENNLSRNVPVDTASSLDSVSDEFRDNNLHRNVKTSSSIDDVANQKRLDDALKGNQDKNTLDLSESSESFRENNLHKNIVSDDSSIDNLSDSARKNNLSKNLDNDDESDLLLKSAPHRKDDLSKNVASDQDIVSDSTKTLHDNLSRNVQSESDLLSSSELPRQDELSRNKSIESDLLSSSEEIRNNSLSRNKPINASLEEMSKALREDSLANNTPSNSDLILDSEDTREDALSANKPKIADVLSSSELIRQDELSKNKSSDSDLLEDSDTTRQDSLSKNKTDESDILLDSEKFRDNNVSANSRVESDLLELSEQTREDSLSKNTLVQSDLLVDSESVRSDLLSTNNNTNDSDLIIDSEGARDGLLSKNDQTISSDLLIDSEQTREDLLSANVPSESDLLSDSIPFFANNISANVIENSNLLEDSQAFLDNSLANNVPIGSDLLIDSESYRDNALSSNVSSSSDLLSSSEQFLDNNLSANDPSETDLLAESIPIRNDLIAKNVMDESNLLDDSKGIRSAMLSSNKPILPGVVVEGLGTATYLGISRVLTQGLVIRTFLESKNKPNPILDFNRVNSGLRENAVKRNDYVIGGREYSNAFANTLSDKVDPRGIDLVGYFNKSVRLETQNQIQSNFLANTMATKLKDKYAPVTPRGEDKTVLVRLGGGYYRTAVGSPQGGAFDTNSSAGSVEYIKTYGLGEITNAIRNYNLSKNLYNLHSIQGATSTSEYIEQLKANDDLGFQDLINKTIGAFSNASSSVGIQTMGSATPRGILTANNFQYFKVSPEKLLRPNEPSDPSQKEQWMENPESLMAKTVAGNIFEDSDFSTARRGVRYVTKTIRNNKNVPFSVNFDPQNTKKYVIGGNASGPIYSRQKYTVANPYSPPNAKSLIFYIKNYSSGDAFYFPPYISSYDDSHSANWNEVNFLGRPEAVYTYNNSSRKGSLAFFVLTDYTQNFVIGTNYGSDEMEDITIEANKNFTSSDSVQNKQRTESYGERDRQLRENEELIAELLRKKEELFSSSAGSNLGGAGEILAGSDKTSEISTLNQQIQDLQIQNYNIVREQNQTLNEANTPTSYNVSGPNGNNVFGFMTNNPSSREPSGDINTTAADTKKRIDEMVKGLMFQPAYFSGSKEDFLTRMEFLAKLTKPARAQQGSGFSFTRAPVAHLRLGDWWDHDIIIDSVSVDYADSPWTLDEGRVQPMWATVKLSFSFVGPYGGEGSPVLSTDRGGIYSPRTSELGSD